MIFVRLQQKVNEWFVFEKKFFLKFEDFFFSYFKESFHHNNEQNMDGMHLDCMMGAPERVFHRCATVFLNDEEIPKDGDILLERMFNEALIQMASLGETVLGK